MDKFLVNRFSNYLIYGLPRSGKTYFCHDLIHRLEGNDKTLVITSSPEDYTEYETTPDYEIEKINAWLSERVPKILVLDDFLHLTTENGTVARHIRSILSSGSHDDKMCNVIISSQILTMGKYIRTICSTIILFQIDEDSEKLFKTFVSRKKQLINSISQTLQSNKHSFLILNKSGEWQISKLR